MVKIGFCISCSSSRTSGTVLVLNCHTPHFPGVSCPVGCGLVLQQAHAKHSLITMGSITGLLLLSASRFQPPDEAAPSLPPSSPQPGVCFQGSLACRDELSLSCPQVGVAQAHRLSPKSDSLLLPSPQESSLNKHIESQGRVCLSPNGPAQDTAV